MCRRVSAWRVSVAPCCWGLLGSNQSFGLQYLQFTCCVQLDWLRVKASPLLEPVLGHLTHNNPSWNELILIAPDDINSDACNTDFACRKALFRQCYKREYAQKTEGYTQCIFTLQLAGQLVPTARFIEMKSEWLLANSNKMGQAENRTFGRKTMNFVKWTLHAPRFNCCCLQNESSYHNNIYYTKT
jgi:hypothetical protein